MKFARQQFEITKEYAEKLRNRMGAFLSSTKTRYGIILTFVTTFGVVKSMYGYMAQSEVTLDDLFESPK